MSLDVSEQMTLSNTGADVSTLPNVSSANVRDITGPNDSTLFVRIAGGRLYTLNGERWRPVTTPSEMTVTGQYFRSSNDGVIIGQSAIRHAGQSWIGPVILIFVLLLAGGIGYTLYRLIRRKRWRLLTGLGVAASFLAAGVIYLANQKENRSFIFEPNSHFIMVEQPLAEAAITHDGGMRWHKVILPTNFNLTSVISADSGYLIGSYANVDHPDGDLWELNFDTLQPAKIFNASRAIWGLEKAGSAIYAYGSDVSVAIVGSPWAKVPGEILRTDDRLDSLHIINLPRERSVLSLSTLPASKSLWIIAGSRRLLRLVGTMPQATATPYDGMLAQVVAADSAHLFILDTTGNVSASSDEGKTWHGIDFKEPEHINKLSLIGNQMYLIGDSGYIGKLTFK